jgi:hypothetical protein
MPLPPGSDMYDDYAANEQQAGGMSELGMLGLYIGVDVSQRWTTSRLLGSRMGEITKNRSRIGGFFQARREAYAQSRGVSQAFWRTSGGLRTRWAAARTASRAGMLETSPRLGSALAQSTKTTAARGGAATKTGKALLGRVASGARWRTVAGLMRAPLGVANAYLWLGSLVPLAAEGVMAGLSAAASEGRRIRNATPETSVGWQDMATRERAFTMRQASQMAIHMSQSGTRAALGNEADFLH